MNNHHPTCKLGPDCDCAEREQSEKENNLTTIAQLIEELEWAKDCYGSNAKVSIAGFRPAPISVVSNEQLDEYPASTVLLES